MNNVPVFAALLSVVHDAHGTVTAEDARSNVQVQGATTTAITTTTI